MHGGPYPTILSAADEIAVEAFVAGNIRFPDIAAVVEETLSRYSGPTSMSFDLIADVDHWARSDATSIIESRAI
jgi:1-deoxy-D-xylulose-5-phosphate reductoisomerase